MNHEKLYEKYHTPKRSITHMKKIAYFSELIAEMTDLEVNKELLKNSALLHDLIKNPLNPINDFELVWGHQEKVRQVLTNEGHPLIAETASRHNSHGLTIKESLEWGHPTGVDLTPISNESKIIAFADGLRKEYIQDNDCVTIRHQDYRLILKKHQMLVLAEQRKKNLQEFLISHGMNYKKILTLI